LLVCIGLTIYCCRRKSTSTNTSQASIVARRSTKNSSSDRVVLETGHNAISDADVWNPKLEELEDKMMDGHMTIKRPEVELDPGIVNKSFEFESRRSENLDFDLPERDYEVTVNGMTDIDIMMEDEFNELERDYPRPHY